MSESLSVTSGVAGRYAVALFTLCEEQGKVNDLQKDIDLLDELMGKSQEFRSFVESPIYKREQQEVAISALSKHIKVSNQTTNLLCLLARKGRLFILQDFIAKVKALIENAGDEVGVDIVSAGDLTKNQVIQLEKIVSKILKKNASIQVSVDKDLIGGMIVKLGSKMIDTTIKSKLMKLQNSMKEVN